MKKCINLSHPDFIKLVEESGIDALSLANDISEWQDQEASDDFPTLAQLREKAGIPTIDLQYPIGSKKSLKNFKKAVDQSNISQASKDGLHFLLNKSHNKVYLKMGADDVESTYNELKKFIPESYLNIEDTHVVDGIELGEIEVINPTIKLDPVESFETLLDRVEDQMLSDVETFEKFSTFLSDNEARRGKRNLILEAYVVDLMKKYGIEVIEDAGRIERDLNDMVSSGIITPDYQNRVWAFAKVLADGTYTGTVHLKPNGFTTEDLYEEAGHIFTYWLEKYRINVEGVDFKLWNKPDTGTDYLSLTPEYKGRYNKAYSTYLNRIEAEIDNLKDLQIERNDPNISDDRFDFINQELQKESNTKLLAFDLNLKSKLADKLARIEITGQLVGGALEAAARNSVYKVNLKSSGAAAVIEAWLEKLMQWFKKLKTKLFGNAEDIGKLWKAVLNKEFLKELDKIGADRKGFEKFTQGVQGFANDINSLAVKPQFEINKDLQFVQIISKERRSDIHALLEKVPDDLKIQKEALEKELDSRFDPAFLEYYFDYLDFLEKSPEVISGGIPKDLWRELRLLNKDESNDVLFGTNIKENEGLDSLEKGLTDAQNKAKGNLGLGIIKLLEKPLSAIKRPVGSAWELYTNTIRDIHVNTRLEMSGIHNEEVKKEIKKRVIAFNLLIENGLKTNVVEGTKPGIGKPSHYELHHGKYLRYLDKLKDIEVVNTKLNTVESYIKKEQVGKAVQLFLLGKEIPIVEGTYKIPPLFDELDSMLKIIDDEIVPRIKVAKERYEAALLKTQNTRNAFESTGSIPGSLEDTNLQTALQEENTARALLKTSRPDKYQYDLILQKLEHFTEIADNLGARNQDLRKSMMQYFPEGQRKQAEVQLIGNDVRDGAVQKLLRIQKFLLDYKMERIQDQVEALDKTETGANLKFYKPFVQEELHDIGTVEVNFGAKQNSDKTFANLVAALGRLSSKAQIAATDKRIELFGLLNKHWDFLESHPTIKKMLEKTKSGKIQELFHEIVDGERTHYLASEWKHDELARKQDEYMQLIYKTLNLQLEASGSTLRVPTGDLVNDQLEREKLFRYSNVWELTEDPRLQELRQTYRNMMVGFHMTFNESKPEAEREAIKKRWKDTMSPSQYAKAVRNSEKKVRPYLTKDEYLNRIKNDIPVYDIIHLGELSIPATRAKDIEYQLSNKVGDEYQPYPLHLPAVNFENKEFKELLAIPQFKEVYDYILGMQKEIYDKIQRMDLTYFNRLRLYQSGAFEGDGVDTWERLKNGELGAARKRVGDIIKSIYEINDEEKFVFNRNKPEIPMRGTSAYQAPGRLADNYIELISKYWQSLDNFHIKNQGIQEWETMRSLLKLRQVTGLQKSKATVWQQVKGNYDDVINYNKDIETSTTDISDTWADMIDDWLERDLYEEHTSFPDWVKDNPSRMQAFFLLSKLPGVTTFLKLAANIYSASGASSQSGIGFAGMALSGRFLQSRNSSNVQTSTFLQAAAHYGKLWFEDRINAVVEYGRNRNFTKTTLVQEYFGMIERQRDTQKYQSWFTHFVKDLRGYGLMKMANFRPARVFTKAALQSYKWIDEAAMFMTPDVYHRWKSIGNIRTKIEDTRADFYKLGNSAWDMLEVQDGKIQPLPAHQAKFTLGMRAAIHQYLSEGFSELDMRTSDQPKVQRTLWGKFAFSLKGFLVRWSQQLLQDRNNIALNTEEKSYLYYFRLTMRSLYDKETRENFKSQKASNYDMRDAFSKFLVGALVVAIGEQMATFFTRLAIKNCEDQNYKPLPCWMAAQASYHVKRAVAEIGGGFSISQLMTNLDKPINSWGTFTNYLYNTVTALGLPLEYIMRAFQGDDSETDFVSRGPYKEMSQGTASLLKLDPTTKNFLEFINNEAVMTRDRLITTQLNNEYFPIIPGLNMPDLYRLTLGYGLNKAWEFRVDDDRFKIGFPHKLTPKIILTHPKETQSQD